jgi:hypothetical protein
MRRITFLLASLLITSPALALFFGSPVDPPDGWPNTPLSRYFKGLQGPDNHLRQWDENQPMSCCGIADTVKTKFKVEPGGGPHLEDTWHAWLDNAWVRIPSEKIVPDHAPDGQAYLLTALNSARSSASCGRRAACDAHHACVRNDADTDRHARTNDVARQSAQ